METWEIKGVQFVSNVNRLTDAWGVARIGEVQQWETNGLALVWWPRENDVRVEIISELVAVIPAPAYRGSTQAAYAAERNGGK